jgi:dinuclear metal center YbgI/SA1388 family protein
MARLNQIVAYCNKVLLINEFDDYCPNGLQVDGRDEVNTLVSGVTASQALIERAIEERADAVLVHHGYFWKGEQATLTGVKYQRIRALIRHDISLLAYHLPLDAHLELGNNAQLAHQLNFQHYTVCDRGPAKGLLFYCDLPFAISGEALKGRISSALSREALHINVEGRVINRVGWCTGGAQSFIDQAADLGLDAYITGEASEKTTHIARERGIHFYSAGHHASERYGVQALGEQLQKEFSINHINIDIDNPV